MFHLCLLLLGCIATPAPCDSSVQLVDGTDPAYSVTKVNSGELSNLRNNDHMFDPNFNASWQASPSSRRRGSPSSRRRRTSPSSRRRRTSPSSRRRHLPYSWGDAWKMAHLSAATYCEAHRFNSWHVGSQKYSVDRSKVRFIQNAATKATVGVGRMNNPQGCFVAIRGTHDTVQDIINGVAIQIAFKRPGCHGCKAHAGWLKSWDSVKGTVDSTLKSFGCHELGIYLTGHSLGAALVHYALYDLLDAGYHFMHVTAMETPRPGNPKFATALKHKIAKASKPFDAFRITHYKDIVPHVPPIKTPLGTYLHALPQIYYGEHANSNDYTDCGYEHSSDLGGHHCMNMFPLITTNFNKDHCWFGNMNPCSCGSGLESVDVNASIIV